MPKKFPEEFKRDVVCVARRGDLSQAEVAADFNISVESVRRWVRQADVDDGVVNGQTSSEQNELVQLRRHVLPLPPGRHQVGHRVLGTPAFPVPDGRGRPRPDQDGQPPVSA